MTKFVEYKRVSTDAQGKSGLGLDGQQIVLDLFTSQGEVIGSYTDIASGAKLEGRPELDKAIIQAVRDEAVLIVSKADRLSRNVVNALTVLDRVGEERLMCCDCPDTNRLVLTMLFAFAEHERKLISMRTKAALAIVKVKGSKSGKPIGRPVGAKVSKVVARKATANRTAAFREKIRDEIEIIRHYIEGKKTYGEIVEILKVGNHTNSKGEDFTYGQVRLIARDHL